MKKILLLVSALCWSASMFCEKYQLDIHNLNGGWDCEFDAATATINFNNGTWKGKGWYFGTGEGAFDATAYERVEIKFNAVTFKVQVVVEYAAGGQTKVEAEAGKTECIATFDAEKKNAIVQIYIQNAEEGLLTLTDAYITDGADDPVRNNIVIDFENDELGAFYASIRGGNPAENAEVVENPLKAGEKSIKYICTSYSGQIIFPMTLPNGKTLDDYSGIAFDAYVEGTGDTYKEIEICIGEQQFKNGTYPKVAVAGSWTTTTRTFAEMAFIELNAISGNFDLRLGLNDNQITYYLDNITLIEKVETSVKSLLASDYSLSSSNGTIIINGATTEPVTVYTIDGRIAAQSIGNARIPVSNGLYIVKLGAKVQKLLVK
ncbi:MAG: T9SS type A sorting domain-containing protein [Bacteroidales bacterium]|jgi:hypothetical protein|nr:T9SS type A sorting domain-containing protein [Bacteroidales bacterium]